MTQKPVRLDILVGREHKFIEQELENGEINKRALNLLKHYENQRQAIYRKWEQRALWEKYGRLEE